MERGGTLHRPQSLNIHTQVINGVAKTTTHTIPLRLDYWGMIMLKGGTFHSNDDLDHALHRHHIIVVRGKVRGKERKRARERVEGDTA